MPTYEFACPCGHTEERIISITKAPPVGASIVCARCSRDSLRRIISTPTIADAKLRTSIAGYPYISRRHHGLSGCKENADGHPIIKSPAHEREVMSRNNLVRE